MEFHGCGILQVAELRLNTKWATSDHRSTLRAEYIAITVLQRRLGTHVSTNLAPGHWALTRTFLTPTNSEDPAPTT